MGIEIGQPRSGAALCVCRPRVCVLLLLLQAIAACPPCRRSAPRLPPPIRSTPRPLHHRTAVTPSNFNRPQQPHNPPWARPPAPCRLLLAPAPALCQPFLLSSSHPGTHRERQAGGQRAGEEPAFAGSHQQRPQSRRRLQVQASVVVVGSSNRPKEPNKSVGDKRDENAWKGEGRGF